MELRMGIKTTPMHVSYEDIRRVWQEADEIPEIADAWLWDHMMPLAGDRGGPALEGWTTLAALAGQTSRLRMGLLVTSNRFRPPAVLGKMATTVDVISGGRLIMGLGVGGTVQPADTGGIPGENPGVMEYAAYGIPLISPREGIARLVETVTILRRMWTQDAFDFEGPFTTLAGTRNAPKPVQPAGPPLLIGGWGDRTLRVVAEHADIWNIPGPPHNSVESLAERSRALDRHCAAVGRDPSEVVRSVQVIVAEDGAAEARETIAELVRVGFRHVVVGSRRMYQDGGMKWLVEEVIRAGCEVGVG
ncbi:alkanesulfonate monooxygenase SsuD/methylene tetrahydromethanopterin reductase-like flavin-dependent oxidoreductase (luciferase family) [Catenulispora sp. MAP12-49]|uniref:LLM class flavin-dependent oxidoreductase n=1 Tax=Catenulispora sp. MAP12-49 TaxID=3156302 RepID=UPI003511F624